MASQETNIMHKIMIAIGKHATNCRLFRNNVGQVWTGEVSRIFNKAVITVFPGDVVIRNARPFKAGLCKGSSDLIGWTSVVVTPDMVGQKIAIFTALEEKTHKGRASTEQLNFISTVKEFGGIAGIARSEAEALVLINQKTNII